LYWVANGWPAKIDKEESEAGCFKQYKEGLHTSMGILLYGARVVVPKALRAKVLEELHDTHQGIVRSKAKARQHMFWPGITEDVEQMVRNCEKCQSWGANTPESEVHPTGWPKEAWAALNMDLAGPVAGRMLLIVTDQMSKWMEVAILAKADSGNIITELRKMFANFGIPRTIMADNASYFQSDEMSTYCRSNGIRLAASSPYHPRSNGQAERGVQSIKSALNKMRDEHIPLQEAVSRFLLDYRATPQTTTGLSPAELLMNKKLRTRLD
jgi:hypothetical protein